MVGLLTLTGGVSLTGVLLYQGLGRKKSIQQWWKTSWQTVQEALPPTRQQLPLCNASAIPLPDTTTADIVRDGDAVIAASRYGLHTSALALGVTAAGELLFPPLRVAGLPLLVFMGIPPAQAAYAQLQVDGRPNRALAETVALVMCLAGGYYAIGALAFCLYHGGRLWLAAQQPSVAQPDAAAATPHSAWLAATTAHLRKEGTTCTVATATLQPGDQIMLYSGEIAAMDGLITEGVAWLHPQPFPAAAYALHKGVGERINAQDLVVVGRICVRVLRPA